MTQLGMGVAALNHDSLFQAAYEKGIKKSEYWTYTLDDCINLIARLPALAARIYRNVYKPGTPLPAINKDLDLVGTKIRFNQLSWLIVNNAGNYSALLGFGDNHSLTEYLRLYIALHGDHEGGNASAHTARTRSFRGSEFMLNLNRFGRFYALRPILVVLCGAVRSCWTIARVR
jgi:citrate synthase